MPARDARIDAYVAHAQPFARPILKHLRTVVHDACPTVEETMKGKIRNWKYVAK